MRNRLIRLFVRLLDYLVPKNKNSFYLRSIFAYPDNIDAILDKMLRCSKNNKIIYYLDTPIFRYKTFSNVKHIKNKLSSFWHFLRSKYVFTDNGIFKEIRPVRTQIIVNVWHGVSFKRIGFFNKKEKPYPTATFIVTYSPFFQKIMSDAFGVNAKYVLTTGEPRNDYLFKPINEQERDNLSINGFDKIIMWMPTYRQSKYENISDGKRYQFGFPFLDESTIIDLNELCCRRGILLILKWHGLQRIPNLGANGPLSNIKFLTSDELSHNGIALNRLLSNCDALITDYSSVFINYLLLDRPICFAYDDLDYYKKNRGFMFDDIERYMPGFHANSFENIIQFINDIADGKDDYQQLRKKLKYVLNSNYDAENSERLLRFLNII